MTDDGMGNTGDSGATASENSRSEPAGGGTPVASADSSALSEASLDHDLSDHSGFKHGKFHHPLESRYSGTASENLNGDTQGSISRGTSNSGASTVST